MSCFIDEFKELRHDLYELDTEILDFRMEIYFPLAYKTYKLLVKDAQTNIQEIFSKNSGTGKAISVADKTYVLSLKKLIKQTKLEGYAFQAFIQYCRNHVADYDDFLETHIGEVGE